MIMICEFEDVIYLVHLKKKKIVGSCLLSNCAVTMYQLLCLQKAAAEGEGDDVEVQPSETSLLGQKSRDGSQGFG